jgi:cation transport ATPase
LERLKRIDTLVVDKTGTPTEGKPKSWQRDRKRIAPERGKIVNRRSAAVVREGRPAAVLAK